MTDSTQSTLVHQLTLPTARFEAPHDTSFLACCRSNHAVSAQTPTRHDAIQESGSTLPAPVRYAFASMAFCRTLPLLLAAMSMPSPDAHRHAASLPPHELRP